VNRRGAIVVASLGSALAILLLLGTVITTEDGDPLICKECWIGGHHHHASEVSPWRPIHRVARGQFHYFDTDPDAKGRKEFWRKDIAGLWWSPGKDAERLRLILMGDAFADDRPAVDLTRWGVRGPVSGYRLHSLLHEDEASPQPTRFAVCSYPADVASGKWTYIVDELGVLYRKELGPDVIPSRYPGDPIASGWRRFREVDR